MRPPEPRPLAPDERAAFDRRRRGRNLAMLVGLLALVALFYLITLVKLGAPHG